MLGVEAKYYQEMAARTLIEHPGEFCEDDLMLIWTAIGLAGEAGEVAELVKKGIFHRHGLDRDKLANELGDVLWYVAGLCTVAGLDMAAVMEGNLVKLMRRYPDGFSTADSVRRVDVGEAQP